MSNRVGYPKSNSICSGIIFFWQLGICRLRTQLFEIGSSTDPISDNPTRLLTPNLDTCLYISNMYVQTCIFSGIYRKSVYICGMKSSSWKQLVWNLSDKKKFWSALSLSFTLTWLLKIALTGLWSDSFDSPLSYASSFSPSPCHIILSHLKSATVT